jgi:diguanylate cyclase
MGNISKEKMKSADIMVIDNPDKNFEILSDILLKKEYFLRFANTGKDAVEQINMKTPDIIILSKYMSEPNGFEICKMLKTNPNTQKIPVVFTLDIKDIKDISLCFEAGGIDFITKPYKSVEVITKLENYLNNVFLRTELERADRLLVAEIKKRELTKYSLYREKELLHVTLLSIGEGVICTDREGNITLINEVAKNLTGWNNNSAAGIHFDEVFRTVDAHTEHICKNRVKEVIDSGMIISAAENLMLISKDGVERPIAKSAAPIRNRKGEIIGAVIVFFEITKKSVRQNEVEYLRFHDQLTGLYNRSYFEKELIRLDSHGILPITLLIGDLNGLKITNDAFGHLAGDKLLREAANILRNCLRHDEIICRYGGDEFIIIFPNTGYEDMKIIVNRINELIKKSEIKNGVLSITFGWETKRNDSEDIFTVLKKAEDNMYEKKLLEAPSVRSSTIQTIIKTLYEKNKREERHSKRVSELCVKIGKEMNLSEQQISELKTAGLLHDIGKIVLLDSVLDKKDKLEYCEWDEIKRHPEIGYRILSSVSYMSQIAKDVLSHHERWDGKGYPNGLKGEAIPVMARIIAVADAYDAMTNERPYRKTLSDEAAAKEIINNSGKQFDPNIAKIFLDGILKKIS